MARSMKFLTKMPTTAANIYLERLVRTLPHPAVKLLGRQPAVLPLPANLICFQRRAFIELNQPRRGRALHHRFVLICALREMATVCVDDRELALEPGHGLLVFPFQFHHYARPTNAKLCWLFITFELASPGELEMWRFRPFELTLEIRRLLSELLSTYEASRQAELPILWLAVLLGRLRQAKPMPRRTVASEPSLLTQVNVLAQRNLAEHGVKKLARGLGISPSHLRTRFRASCGVSLGRHLRRLRLEKACGLLRLTPNRVSEVAEVCGFNSIYSFSRTFRVAYGISPLAYRQGKRPRFRYR